jgi:DNA-binding MarR family transcriptional regulator
LTRASAGTDPIDAWTADAGIPEAEVGLLTRVVRLNMLVTRVLDDLVEPHDITVSDFLVLALIRRGRSSPVELCKVLGRTAGGMSLTLERLATAGWVDRRPDPRDRRRIIVELMAEGRTKAEVVNQALHEWEAALDLTAEMQAKIEDDLIAVTSVVVGASGSDGRGRREGTDGGPATSAR